MEVIIQGVRITLTEDQIKLINDHHSKQKQECTTFTKALKSFGFKKMSTKGWLNPDANCWETAHWFIEIYNSGTLNEYCSVVGAGIELSMSGYPLTIYTPQELCEILNKALDEIENGK